ARSNRLIRLVPRTRSRSPSGSTSMFPAHGGRSRRTARSMKVILVIEHSSLLISIVVGDTGSHIACGGSMRLLTFKHLAKRLGLKPSCLRFWVWQRKIETVRVGRAVRIREDTIQRLIREGTTPARRS